MISSNSLIPYAITMEMKHKSVPRAPTPVFGHGGDNLENKERLKGPAVTAAVVIPQSDLNDVMKSLNVNIHS